MLYRYHIPDNFEDSLDKDIMRRLRVRNRLRLWYPINHLDLSRVETGYVLLFLRNRQMVLFKTGHEHGDEDMEY